MGCLTTHVLDTSSGKPAVGLRIELFLIDGDGRSKVAERWTNDDGRCDGPILKESQFAVGVFELLFHVGAYFDANDVALPELKFLDVVPVRFGIADADGHYHVPLLIAPFGYSTYRGS